MIVISVELWPFGFESQKKVLGRAEIFNDGTGTAAKGNYGFKIEHKGRSFREGKVISFPRKRLNSFDLLLRVLQEAVGKRS